MQPFRAAFDRATIAFVIVLALATAARIAALYYNQLDLYYDEAQYWFWSRELDWGYYTKPPLIAWAIAATTSLFGDAEWAVRLSAPIAHAIAASALFALGRSTYGAWPGFWTGVAWLLMPGVFLSSAVVSTDALLLPLWALALFSAWRLMTTRAWVWAVALGIFVGLGTLAKYAMLYFVLCMALAALWLSPVREALKGGRGIVAGVIAAAVIAPNVVWNFQNGFATARHTADNARFDVSDMFNIDELFEFWGGQFGVLGPVAALVLIWAIWRAARRWEGASDQDKFLLAFVLPTLIIVSCLAFISRANANWVAVAYPAIVAWTVGSLFDSRPGRVTLAASLAINALIGATVLAAATMPQFANLAKAVRTAQGWELTATQIAERARPRSGEPPFTAVLVDNREAYFELNYYWRESRRRGEPLPPVRMWLLHGEAHNSAEAADPMRAEEGARVLVVHAREEFLPYVAGDFTVFRTIEHLTIPLGGDFTRELELSIGEGFAPVERDDAFRRRLEG
jgi:4-amino-4-deoxy-L-arabinose transferase-like glycosyltransferase